MENRLALYSDLPARDEHWVCVAGGCLSQVVFRQQGLRTLLLCGQRLVPNWTVIHLRALSYPFLSDCFLIEMEFPGLDWLGQVYVDEKALELLVLLVTCPVLCWGGTPGLGV